MTPLLLLKFLNYYLCINIVTFLLYDNFVFIQQMELFKNRCALIKNFSSLI